MTNLKDDKKFDKNLMLRYHFYSEVDFSLSGKEIYKRAYVSDEKLNSKHIKDIEANTKNGSKQKNNVNCCHIDNIKYVSLDGQLLASSTPIIFEIASHNSEVKYPIEAEVNSFYLSLLGAENSEKNIIGVDRIAITDKNGKVVPVSPASYLLFEKKDELLTTIMPRILACLDMPKSTTWWKRSGLFQTSLKISENEKQFIIEGTVHLQRFLLGEICAVVPVPDFPKTGLAYKDPKHLIAVGILPKSKNYFHYISSDPSIENLKSLTRHLRSRDPHRIWIMGDPGSGKEIFSRAFHYGSVSSFGYNLVTRSFGGANYSEFTRRLFTSEDGKMALIERCEREPDLKQWRLDSIDRWPGSIANLKATKEECNKDDTLGSTHVKTILEKFAVPNSKNTLVLDYSHPNYNSAISFFDRAAKEMDFPVSDSGGTMFLDEFDKVGDAKQIYSSMLRVLEAKEYILREYSTLNAGNSPVIKELPKEYKTLNWIFAGAFSQSNPKEDIPLDFWSRLSGILSIKNPLKNSPEYAANLFVLFYAKAAFSILDKDSYVQLKQVIEVLKLPENKRSFSQRVFASTFSINNNNSNDAGKIFRLSQNLLNFAHSFSKQVFISPAFESNTIDSVRSVRQATLVAFYHMRNKAIEFQASSKDTFDFKENADKAIELASDSLILSRGP